MCGLNSAPRNSLSGTAPRFPGIFRVRIGLTGSPFLQTSTHCCAGFAGSDRRPISISSVETLRCNFGLHTTPAGCLDPSVPPHPRRTLKTSCFRRLFRSHGPTLTLSVPEPLLRVVLLSSAKTLRRYSGLHATPVDTKDSTAPSRLRDTFRPIASGVFSALTD